MYWHITFPGTFTEPQVQSDPILRLIIPSVTEKFDLLARSTNASSENEVETSSGTSSLNDLLYEEAKILP